MPIKSKYDEQSKFLAQAIDIAVNSFNLFPPKGWDKNVLEQVVNAYTRFKNNALNPEPQFKNMRSFQYILNDVLTYFQESSGSAVDNFWVEIRKNHLPYIRENKMAKILKAGKIKHDIDCDFVIDTIVPYQQEGLINGEQILLLNKMIANFENKRKAKST
ncbi:hypothetical protein [Mucilaginibacter glaciei]|uniref:Uncharacterized protein n=1 Tax=Mucilaginibacter glaciei TaxID=2772109 RepID=A0A926NU49_9SPHI|nr:hypothetical protein [Mucilaginibacter glaciei]MBD1391813.1 hypothetical protein [Mucilaginibacter glaciei]